jgi:hypothetical protein
MKLVGRRRRRGEGRSGGSHGWKERVGRVILLLLAVLSSLYNEWKSKQQSSSFLISPSSLFPF